MAIINAGFGAVPIPLGGKYPPPAEFTGGDGYRAESLKHVRAVIRNGYRAHDPDTGELRHYEAGGLGLRFPAGGIGIDVDTYGEKRGAERRAELEQQWGKLPPTYYVTSRGPDQPSRILLYRATAGRKYGDPGGDIEIPQHHWRYAVMPPSQHPEGRTYVLYGPDGEEISAPADMPSFDDLPRLPRAWDDGLARLSGSGLMGARSAAPVPSAR
jgi:hypothetical protein